MRAWRQWSVRERCTHGRASLAGFHEPPPTSAGTPEYADELRPRYFSMLQNAGPRVPCLASTNAWRTRAMRPLSEQALADVLGQGLEMYDLYLEPPVAEEAHLVMPRLRSRLRLLPEPRPIEEPGTSQEAREQLVEAFATSPEAACLEPAEIAALPEVLRRFVRFSARRKGLGDELIAETLEIVDRVAPGLAAGMADDEHAGPANWVVKELLAARVDLTDQAAMQRWIDARNADLAGGTGGHHRQRRGGT